MQTAFCFRVSLPATGACVVSWLAVGYGFGAVITADAGEALLMKLIERYVVLLDVLPNVFPSLFGQRAELDDFVL